MSDAFSVNVLCVCGCAPSAHRALYEGDVYKGVRCIAHGRHAFAEGRQEAFALPRVPAPSCRSCGSSAMVLGVCTTCGAGARMTRPRRRRAQR